MSALESLTNSFVAAFNVFLNPNANYKQVQNAELSTSAILLAIAGFIAGIFQALSTIFLMSSFAIPGLISSMAAFTLIILAPIGALIGWLIWTIVIFILIYIAGARPGFSHLASWLAYPLAASTIISGVLSLIPFVGSILSSLVTLYMLYVIYILLQKLEKATSGQALLPVIIIGIFVVLTIIANILLQSILISAKAFTSGMQPKLM
ncbi:MAG: Yip1 family protein [archaeon]